jgi:TatD DNase family protein
MLVDTHLHLDLEQFDPDRADVIANARAAGVQGFVLIGFDERRWNSTAALCDAHAGMVRTAGVHPNSAMSWHAGSRTALAEQLVMDDVVALGEIGLDFFRDNSEPDVQREVFIEQLELARELELPVIIHQRSAEQEVLEVLTHYAPLRGVMHCFSGDLEFAARCLALGFHLGLGGVVTYPKSDLIREAVAAAPLDRLLLETDAPFLAPQAWRGKRNQPAYVGSVAECIAQLVGVHPGELAERTTRNAVELFGPSLAAALQQAMSEQQ